MRRNRDRVVFNGFLMGVGGVLGYMGMMVYRYIGIWVSRGF